MKQILLLSFLTACTFIGNAQTFNFGTYPNCQLPAGFGLGQGAQVRPYDNPNIGGCTNNDDDCGIETPGVGGNNPVNIRTPQLAYTPPAGTQVRVTFDIYIWNSDGKCDPKPFPCPTYVTGYVVDLAYNSNTAPTTFYGSSERQLVTANGANLVRINVTTTPTGPTRIYLDFSTDLTCNQPNTKYIIDRLSIPEEIVLPVSLKSFSANRQNSNVSLTWVTSNESINKGFDVQRLSGTDNWETIAFVPSQAKDGFSNRDIAYSYSDANTNKTVTQYRLVQQDFDGKQTYSAVRAVQGLSQVGRIIVSPNPGRNGQTNVIFENAVDRRNLQLTDMVGRVVKQWSNYTDNSLQLTNLLPGMYQLRIVNAATGAQSVEKIMVSGN